MSLNSSQVMKTNDLLDTEGGREENILPSLMSGLVYIVHGWQDLKVLVITVVCFVYDV